MAGIGFHDAGLGAVHALSGDWTAPRIVLIAITALELVPGVPAALRRTIRGESQ